jgi:predicted kinase
VAEIETVADLVGAVWPHELSPATRDIVCTAAPVRYCIPVLIVVSGLPCTGKSELAARIAPALGAPIFSVDPIESAILRAGIARTFETGVAAYLVAEALAGAQLSRGGTAIIDAVSSVEWAKTLWRELAARHATALRVIECRCSNEVVYRERLAARDRGMAFAEPTWTELEARRAEYVPWTEPVLVVDAIDALDDNARRGLVWLASG